MENVYMVVWSTAMLKADSNVEAFNSVFGVYKTLDRAEKALERCKKDFINGITDYSYIQESGSVKERYFEIDYLLNGLKTEIYLQIVDRNLMD